MKLCVRGGRLMDAGKCLNEKGMPGDGNLERLFAGTVHPSCRPVRRIFDIRTATAVFVALWMVLAVSAAMAAKPCHHIVVLADLHLPGRMVEAKNAVIDRINEWADVDEVVVVGDVCNSTGTDAEYVFVKRFFERLRKPFTVINGNHDYVFADRKPEPGSGRHFEMGSIASRKAKLKKFLETFGMERLYFDRVVAGYHLVFLSLDSLTSPFYACLSDDQLKWFDNVLGRHSGIPAIVFCHSPIWGHRLLEMNPKIAHFLTQPVDRLEEIVPKHPELFLWVSGHVHLGIFNEMQASPINRFMGQVDNVENCDLDGRSILHGMNIQLEQHDDLWTKSLFLYPDRVVVKVFDHVRGRWLPKLEKTYPVPVLR